MAIQFDNNNITLLNVKNNLKNNSVSANKVKHYQEQQGSDKALTANQSNSSATDSVTLTDSAMNLKKMEAQISAMPIIDMKKVEQLQQQINNGTYQIDAGKIADRFIAMEKALAGL